MYANRRANLKHENVLLLVKVHTYIGALEFTGVAVWPDACLYWVIYFCDVVKFHQKQYRFLSIHDIFFFISFFTAKQLLYDDNFHILKYFFFL